jgi:dihydroneopterin aldolase
MGVAAGPAPASPPAAGASGALAVLAPHAWLRAADPLPHSWDVTSDSIAAWVAGALGAAALVLVKAAGAAGDGLVDAYFARALPAGVAHLIVPADQRDALALALDRSRGGAGGG